MTDPIEQRKAEHVDVVLHRDVAGRGVSTGLEQVRFAHAALPELALDEIDLACSVVGRRMAAPLLVSSMTGGPARALGINRAIAEACAHHGIGFGVGSQRIALEQGAGHGFDRALRQLAPKVPILANFGAAQLRVWARDSRHASLDMVARAIDMIDADAVIIHLNPLQEAVQVGGDIDWRGVLFEIERLCAADVCPVIVKEVGFGIGGATARRLWDAGVRIIDVAGAGGTNWAAVEAERMGPGGDRDVADAFRDWGIPTADCVRDVRAACPDAVIIASGGLRSGVDCAKAIRVGADLAAIATGVLDAATRGPEPLSELLGTLIRQLRITCFATGSADLAALKCAPLIAAPTSALAPPRSPSATAVHRT